MFTEEQREALAALRGNPDARPHNSRCTMSMCAPSGDPLAPEIDGRMARGTLVELARMAVDPDVLSELVNRVVPGEGTLRDAFAMSALNGMLSYSLTNSYSGNWVDNGTPESNARTAYAYADAMMKARIEPPRADLQGLGHIENPNVEHLPAAGWDDHAPFAMNGAASVDESAAVPA